MILSGRSLPDFSQQLADKLSTPIFTLEHQVFPNGEQLVCVDPSVKNQSVIIVQSLYSGSQWTVNDLLVETLLMVDAVERVGASMITVVVPWLGYSLQDRSFVEGEACSAAVVGKVLQSRLLRAVVAVELHHEHIRDYFSIPVINLSPATQIAKAIRSSMSKEEVVVIAPDMGAVRRAAEVATELQVPIIHLDKTRTGLQTSVTGDVSMVRGKIAVVVDDILNTGSTCATVASYLKKGEAKQVWWVVSHGLFSGNAKANLEKSQLDGLFVGNSIPVPQQAIPEDLRLEQVDLVPLIAQQLSSLA